MDVPWLLIALDVWLKATSKSALYYGSNSKSLSSYHSNYWTVFSIVLGTIKLFTGGINYLDVEGFSLCTLISRRLILLSWVFLHYISEKQTLLYTKNSKYVWNLRDTVLIQDQMDMCVCMVAR